MNEIKTIHSSCNGFTDIKLYTTDRAGLTIYFTEIVTRPRQLGTLHTAQDYIASRIFDFPLNLTA